MLESTMGTKPRYVLIGTGNRGVEMFGRALVGRYSQQAELVGLCDSNPLRMAAAQRQLGINVPVFTDFAACLQQLAPDKVIVTTPDYTHHEFIIAAMRKGCDVITEKPLTIGAEQCRKILQAERETGRSCVVAFNYRYAPFHTIIKEVLSANRIGRVISVDFHYYLDTNHGADYYRRWHRSKANSGGLLIHKATHHFDLLNWWLEQEPAVVFARGDRQYYGPTRDERGVRCSECRYTEQCEFYLDLRANENLAELYLDAESADGYYRDRCVFAPEIDIEDNMQVLVGYNKGANLSYTLASFLPLEGFTIAFNGTKGRLEAEECWGPHLGKPVDNPFERYGLRLYPSRERMEIIPVPVILGGHAGGDERFLDMLFRDDIPDPLRLRAHARAGALSILVGIAANESIAQGKAVTIPPLLDEEAWDGLH